jgi:hypothetical protein
MILTKPEMLSEKVSSKNLARGERAAGEYYIAQWLLPVGADYVIAKVNRIGWPVTDRKLVEVKIEISGNNGSTWKTLGGFSTTGKPSLDRNKDVTLFSSMGVDIPHPESSKRLLRAKMKSREFLEVDLIVDVYDTSKDRT